MKFSDNLVSTSTYFKLLAESIPNFVWTADSSGYSDYFNQRWYNYTGCKESESTGWEWQKCIHEDDLQRCLVRWKAAIASGEGYETEYRIRRHDGIYRWHIGRALPVKDAEGNIVKWFGTCTDVHAQKTLLEERETFAAAITHDLKSPLVGSNLILEVLLSEKIGGLNEKQLDLISQILASNKNILSLLQSLLEFYRDDQNLQSLIIESLDLGSLVTDCASDIQVQADSRNIKLNVESLAEPCTVSIDGLAIRRVLQNLLDNAIKFTADGGEIKVHLSSDAQFFKLVVEDFGAGIEKDVQSTLFQPFTQGPTGRRYTLGSGLGLYLCRQIVEAHQGSITCESELGRGSKFTVLLPCTKNGV